MRVVGRAEDPVAEGADHQRSVVGRHEPGPCAQQAGAIKTVAGDGEVAGMLGPALSINVLIPTRQGFLRACRRETPPLLSLPRGEGNMLV
jgi:hypothetical protein